MNDLRTTVVGSYPVPAWLRAYPSRSGLIDAMMVVLKTQELAGIDVVADGELGRFDVNHPETNGMIDYFVGQMGNVRLQLSRAELVQFQQEEAGEYRTQPAGIVEGEISQGRLNLPADYQLAVPLTGRPLKSTLTGPHMLTKVLMDRHYGNRAELAFAIADVLASQVAAIAAPIIQLDEANISGHPEDSDWAAEALNRVFRAIPAGVGRGLHICFGNYGGQSVQSGLWQALIPFVNQLECDHLILEFARRGQDELPLFREVKEEIGVGIGVIDIKDNVVESPALVARRIESAVKVLGEQRIPFVHPDCGFWMLPRSVADQKMRSLVAGKNLVLGNHQELIHDHG